MSSPYTPYHPKPIRYRFLQLLWVAVVLVNVFVAGMVALVVESNRQRAIEEATTATDNYSKILEENLLGFINKIDITVLATIDEISRQRSHGGIKPKDLEAFLARQDARIPEALGLRVVDKDGVTRFAVNGVSVLNASIADRPHFIFLRDNPNAGLVFSKPIIGHSSKKAIITLGRRIENADGSFGGDVHVSVPIDHFLQMFARLDLGAQGNVGFWDKTSLIARYSKQDAFGAKTGATTPSSTLANLLASEVKSTTYHAMSGIDGIVRTYHFRKVGSYPLFTTVGLADEDFLEEWKKDSLGLSTLAALFVFATLTSAAIAHKAWKRRDVDQQILRQQEMEYTQKLEESNHEAESARHRIELILSSAGEGICGVDLEGKVTFINLAARKMFGWSDEEGIGLLLHELTHHHRSDGTQYEQINCPIYKTLHDGIPRQVNDEVYWRKDGTQFPVEYTVAPLKHKGRIRGAVNVFRNIAERKLFETELINSKHAAEAANLAKSRFLATMSHEIRTPMNGILGMAQLLALQNVNDEERLDFANTILKSGNTLLALLNDILDLSKIESGKMQLEISLTDPQEIIHDCVALFGEAANKKGISIDGVWSGSDGAIYLSDANRIRQMLNNLVNNAIKFTNQGFVRVEATEFSSDGVGAIIRFTVSDSGIGISPEKQKILFNPFSQADSSTTRQYGGTGLGLSIVRSLSHQMGGDAGVISSEGNGSQFWFEVKVSTQN